MKLIDRYILRTFLLPLLVTTVAFHLFFIVYDLFDSFDMFVEAGASLKEVVTYYTFLLPPNFWIIMPIVLLLSVLFALYQLTRHSELTAMRASGISLYRLLVPYVAVGALVALGVGLVDETLGPSYSRAYNDMIYGFKTRTKEKSLVQQEKPPPHILQEILYFNEKNGRDWQIGRMDNRPETKHQIEGVRVHRKFPGTQEYEYKLMAKKAVFEKGGWTFSDAVVKAFKPGLIPVKKQEYRGVEKYRPGWDEPPELFANVKMNRQEQYMSARQIYTFLKRAGDNVKSDQQRLLKSDLHSRLARPLGCFIATLLGIPFGFQTARKGIFTGFLILFGAFFSYYVLFIIFMYLGKSGAVSPIIGAWAPNVVFTMMGLFLFLRMRQ